MNLTELEQNPAFIELKQLYLNVFSENSKPEHLANDARKFAEAICYQIFIAKISQNHNKPLELSKYLEEFKKKNLPLNYIYPQIETIQKIGNYNSHYQGYSIEITAEYIQPAQAAIDCLMNWFLNSQLNYTVLTVKQGKFYQTEANVEPLNPEYSFLLDDIKNQLYSYSIKDLINIYPVDLQIFNRKILTAEDFLEALFNQDAETRKILLTIVAALKDKEKPLAAWFELARYYFSMTSEEFDDFKPLKPKVSSEKEAVVMISVRKDDPVSEEKVNVYLLSEKGLEPLTTDVKLKWKQNTSEWLDDLLDNLLDTHPNTKFTFEFLLNSDLLVDHLNEPVEYWQDSDKVKLLREHSVVVRPLQRQQFVVTNKRRYRRWQQAWSDLIAFATDCTKQQTHWIELNDSVSDELDSFLTQRAAAPCFAMDFQTDWLKRDQDFFNNLINWGVPVAIWSRKYHSDFKTAYEEHVANKPLEQLCEHVKTLRARFCGSAEHPCNHLTLLWDNPNHLIEYHAEHPEEQHLAGID